MGLLGRFVMGLLSVALGVYAVYEIMHAPNANVGGIAVLILLMAIAGLIESLRKYSKL